MKTDSETVRYIETGDGVYLNKFDIICVIQQHIRAHRKLMYATMDDPNSQLYTASDGARAALMILLKDVRDNFGN